MTLEEFVATRRSGLLGEVEGTGDQTPVLIYFEQCYIFADPLPDGKYWTVIENTSPSGSLADVEKELWEWAQRNVV